VPAKLVVERIQQDALIRPSGRLDTNTSADLRKAALKLCAKRRCKNLTIDFTDVSFIDTSGLATLLEILVATKDQCMQLILSNLSDRDRYLIDVNSLAGFFTIESSAREKLDA
jgi:anti-sigma B factor antagonist